MKIGYMKNMENDTSSTAKFERMKQEGVEKIIVELSTNKDNYQKMLLESIETMSEKDILVINSLDDLGENIDDIINVVKKLEEKDIGISVFNAHLDRLSDENDWDLQRLLRKQLLLVLVWVEVKEKNEIRRRQAKGMETIKALKDQKGSGRPKKYSKNAKDPEDRNVYYNVIQMLKNDVPIKRISDTLNISRNTIYTIREEFLHNDNE
ncbi:helix-turn-helix domain-containing protein [Peribacillus sp. R9-11]|uniref:helix-turn-helix domain-containing protein n=1 Tax=Peribacillus sp. R9-11 TaxID=3073271 RepID=UPI0028685AC4|nr:helix-turn-helix domain-containing protein [Peribacillus sp. R9-11]WMX58509.1 helix-turn-helix domain-containing protein [Peribacillus sp. R9-11]